MGLLICVSPKPWVWLSEERPQKEEAIIKEKDQKERWRQRRKDEVKQRKKKEIETSRVPNATHENIFFIFKLRKCNYILLFFIIPCPYSSLINYPNNIIHRIFFQNLVLKFFFNFLHFLCLIFLFGLSQCLSFKNWIDLLFSNFNIYLIFLFKLYFSFYIKLIIWELLTMWFNHIDSLPQLLPDLSTLGHIFFSTHQVQLVLILDMWPSDAMWPTYPGQHF